MGYKRQIHATSRRAYSWVQSPRCTPAPNIAFVMDIRLKDVSHFYDNFEVMRNITLDIPDGRIVCIVGPSGCGKSTLLRFIGGLERPSKGEVLQIGHPPAGCLNPLTYIFQDFALLPWRTVSGNISLVLEDHGIRGSQAHQIINDMLERTNLLDFANALPKQLSGGMKQRVAIARALAVKPAVMLMDEPLSALDSQTRELLIDDLVRLWTRQPFTAVYVTHNLAEAVRLGHSIVVFSRRPAQIRRTLHIDKPLVDRHFGDSDLEQYQKQLWQLMRDEARAADAELRHA
jgi:NitT/TauT family transport system ATP-binding protein